MFQVEKQFRPKTLLAICPFAFLKPYYRMIVKINPLFLRLAQLILTGVFHNIAYLYRKIHKDLISPKGSFKKKLEMPFLSLILFLGVILRIIDILNASGIELDGVFYAKMAEHFSKGNYKEALNGVFPPFYPMLIAFFYLLINDLEYSGRIASTIMGILIILFFYFAIKKMNNKKKALCASLFIAIHPYLVRFSAQVLSESTAIFVFTVAIFLFYWGWTENKSFYTGLSGILLGFAYLTRPEYIVYIIPMSIILIFIRRLKHLLLINICFFTIILPYIFYLRLDTGIWIISKKAILAKEQISNSVLAYSYLLPVLPFSAMLKNVPFVVYHFFEALFPPFIILLFIGIKEIEKRFSFIILLLFIFHVISISLMTSSTRRFSVEFVPVLLVFAVAGLSKVEMYLKRFKKKSILIFLIFFIIIGLSIFQGIISKDSGRLMNKEAGLIMKAIKGKKIIASRLPLVSFYSGSEWVNIIDEIKRIKDCEGLIDSFKEKGVNYIVFDEVLLRFLKEKGITFNDMERMSDMKCIVNLGHKEEFVRVYRIDYGR